MRSWRRNAVWEVPAPRQLARYLPRLISEGAKRKRLVSVSAADRAYAARKLPADLEGVGIVHLSWGDLKQFASQALSSASGFEEKLWLRQWMSHLKEFVSVERQIDNMVYVVALGRQPMVDGQAHSWIDVVEKEKRYFHPVGNTWPKQPTHVGRRPTLKNRRVNRRRIDAAIG